MGETGIDFVAPSFACRKSYQAIFKARTRRNNYPLTQMDNQITKTTPTSAAPLELRVLLVLKFYSHYQTINSSQLVGFGHHFIGAYNDKPNHGLIMSIPFKKIPYPPSQRNNPWDSPAAHPKKHIIQTCIYSPAADLPGIVCSPQCGPIDKPNIQNVKNSQQTKNYHPHCDDFPHDCLPPLQVNCRLTKETWQPIRIRFPDYSCNQGYSRVGVWGGSYFPCVRATGHLDLHQAVKSRPIF